VTRPEQIREEEHFRQVERAMLYVDEAARKVAEAAEKLKQDGGSPHLVAALETAATSVRADHKRLIKSVYWKAPDKSDPQVELVAADGDQERLAS
jgi:hypothetical protein